MYYIGTVLLHMGPITFWRCTPAKLRVLSDVHTSFANPSASNKVANTVEEALKAGVEI